MGSYISLLLDYFSTHPLQPLPDWGDPVVRHDNDHSWGRVHFSSAPSGLRRRWPWSGPCCLQLAIYLFCYWLVGIHFVFRNGGGQRRLSTKRKEKTRTPSWYVCSCAIRELATAPVAMCKREVAWNVHLFSFFGDGGTYWNVTVAVEVAPNIVYFSLLTDALYNRTRPPQVY